MGEVKRCAACGKENPVSEMKVCMHHQMHRYVCDSKCMTDFYNPPKKPTAAELEAKIATLESENAKLRAELERRADDTREARVVGFKPGMGQVTLEVGRLPAWLDMGMTCYVADAPSAPKADDPVKVQLLEALDSADIALKASESALRHLLHNIRSSGKRIDLGLAPSSADEALRRINQHKRLVAAIAAARQEGGKV